MSHPTRILPWACLLLALNAAAQTAPATVSGRVVDGDGNGVADAIVTLMPTDYRGSRANKQTAADGSFTIERVAPGPYRLRIDRTGEPLRGIEALASAADGTTAWEFADPVDGELAPFTIEAGMAVRMELHTGGADGAPFESALARATRRIQGGDCAGAIDALGAHLESFPERARGHYLMGYCRATEGEVDAAAESIGRALELQPGMPGAALLMGQVLLGGGRGEEAAPWLRREATEGTSAKLTGDAWRALAFLERDRDNFDAAIEAFAKLAELTPDDPGPCEEIGRLHYEANRLDEAVEVLANCASHGSVAANTLLNIGIARYNEQAYDGAERAARAALSAAQDDTQRSTAHALLGRCHFHAGRKSEARASLKKSLELDAGGKLAAESRDLLSDLGG